MPFLSIIIPTHNNEEHIEQAINSCFDSEFDDIEVIVVNDASTDKTEEKIRNLQEQRPEKIKLINNLNKVGAGPSRNTGIDNAKGEYLLFLDGDDWFEPNAVRAVENIAKRTEAEVILFNHQRAWADNSKSKNLPNKYTELQLTEKNISKAEIRKGAIKNLHTVWNKSYKLSYIKKINIKFDAGLYQDLPWSIQIFCLANTVHYNPTVLVNYRQREGAATKTTSLDHFEVFNQINKAIKFTLDNKKIKDNYGKEIYEYCKLVIFGIIKVNYRIPKNDLNAFLNKSCSEINRWKKALSIKGFDLPLLSLSTKNRFIFMLTQNKVNHKRNRAKYGKSTRI